MRQVPEVTGERLLGVLFGRPPTLRRGGVVATAAIRVEARDDLLDVVGGVGGGAPLVAVAAHLAVDEESIPHAKALGERMGVGRHDAGEVEQRAVGVGPGQVAEHLIERAILPDDVDHVAEGRKRRRGGRRVPAVGRSDSTRETGQLPSRRRGEKAQ